jgi:uncharacterized protein YdeI (YjbR/CyaY-like superfamily)
MKTQKAVQVPEEFANALKKHKAALAAFEAMPPSHQRQHCEAIAEAKKPETKAKRISSAIEMILTWNEGRRRKGMS